MLFSCVVEYGVVGYFHDEEKKDESENKPMKSAKGIELIPGESALAAHSATTHGDQIQDEIIKEAVLGLAVLDKKGR